MPPPATSLPAMPPKVTAEPLPTPAVVPSLVMRSSHQPAAVVASASPEVTSTSPVSASGKGRAYREALRAAADRAIAAAAAAAPVPAADPPANEELVAVGITSAVATKTAVEVAQAGVTAASPAAAAAAVSEGKPSSTKNAASPSPLLLLSNLFGIKSESAAAPVAAAPSAVAVSPPVYTERVSGWLEVWRNKSWQRGFAVIDMDSGRLRFYDSDEESALENSQAWADFAMIILNQFAVVVSSVVSATSATSNKQSVLTRSRVHDTRREPRALLVDQPVAPVIIVTEPTTDQLHARTRPPSSPSPPSPAPLSPSLSSSDASRVIVRLCPLPKAAPPHIELRVRVEDSDAAQEWAEVFLSSGALSAKDFAAAKLIYAETALAEEAKEAARARAAEGAIHTSASAEPAPEAKSSAPDDGAAAVVSRSLSGLFATAAAPGKKDVPSIVALNEKKTAATDVESSSSIRPSVQLHEATNDDFTDDEAEAPP